MTRLRMFKQLKVVASKLARSTAKYKAKELKKSSVNATLLMDKELNFIFSSYFSDFLKKLSYDDRVKLSYRMASIQKYGLPVAIRQKWVKKLDSNLYEIRSQYFSNIQRAIYFHVDHNNYFITHGFTKKSNKTPIRELNRAKNIRDAYLKRRKNGEGNKF